MGLGIVVAVLIAVAGYAILHETRKAPVVPAASPAAIGHEMGLSERPPMSADEERYAHGLWQVHDQVRTAAIRMTFAGLAYKMGDTDKAAMRGKVSPLSNVFKEAHIKASALVAPPSLQSLHDDYLEAIRLYQEASRQMTKVSKADDDQNLLVAQGMTEKAAAQLLKVGDALWPGEYKPN